MLQEINILVTFQILGDFSVIFLLVGFILIPLWSEEVIFMIYNLLKIVQVCLFAQNMVFLG